MTHLERYLLAAEAYRHGEIVSADVDILRDIYLDNLSAEEEEAVNAHRSVGAVGVGCRCDICM